MGFIIRIGYHSTELVALLFPFGLFVISHGDPFGICESVTGEWLPMNVLVTRMIVVGFTDFFHAIF